MNATVPKRVCALPAMLLACALAAAPVGAAAATAAAAAPEVLDLNEAAALLRVAPRQVLQMAQAHQLPGRLVGGRWRFARSGLLAWLSGQDGVDAPVPAAPSSGAGEPGAPAVPPPALPLPAGQAATAQTDAPGVGLNDWARMAIGEIDLASVTEAAPDREAPKANTAPAGQPGPKEATREAGTLGERPTASTAQEVALRDQGSLLRRGGGSVEFGMFHAHSEQTLIPVVRQEQSAFGVNATVRYGLADDLQVVAGVPGVRNHSTTFSDGSVSGTPQREDSIESHVGDASLSLLGVAMRESTWRPNLILSLDAVLPSGPGDRGLGAGVVISKSFDPAVLFGGVSYLRGLSVNARDPRRSLARNNFALTFGYTYALNDALALNTVFLEGYRDTGAPDPNAIPPPSERYQLQLGMTWMMGRGVYVEPAVAVRLGGAAPDLSESANLVLSY